MAVFYLDTSALVKRYAEEDGTARVVALTEPTSAHDLYTARVTGPEMISALFRKARTGDISLSDAMRSARSFRTDWRMQYHIVEVHAVVCDRAMDLAQRYGLRGYDAIHVAAALALQDVRQSMQLPSLILVSSDMDQLQAAAAEGLPVEDPTE